MGHVNLLGKFLHDWKLFQRLSRKTSLKFIVLYVLFWNVKGIFAYSREWKNGDVVKCRKDFFSVDTAW